MKNERKIRKLLGDRYHLCTSCGINENGDIETVEWYLYKNYDNGDPIYYSNDNKPIMTSETHTEEELYEFAKKHHKVDFQQSHIKLQMVLIAITFIISVVNSIMGGITELSCAVVASDIIILIQILFNDIIFNKNFKVDMLELTEQFKKIEETWGKDEQ